MQFLTKVKIHELEYVPVKIHLEFIQKQENLSWSDKQSFYNDVNDGLEDFSGAIDLHMFQDECFILPVQEIDFSCDITSVNEDTYTNMCIKLDFEMRTARSAKEDLSRIIESAVNDKFFLLDKFVSFAIDVKYL